MTAPRATDVSAEIIVFPGRWHGPAAQPALAEPPPAETADAPEPPAIDPATRLRNALQALDAALATQREAVSEWRSALVALRGSVGGLGDSLRSYNAALGSLGGKLAALRAQSGQYQLRQHAQSGQRAGE